MYFYDIYWGMSLVWWCVWIVLLVWIFVTPYDIPGQRKRRETPIEILKKRLAAGEISNEEYLDKKKMLENNVTDSGR